MKLNQLELLIKTGSVTGVVVFRPDLESPWIIDTEFLGIPPVFSTYLESARHEHRQFATVDAALKVIRSAGWCQPIRVDG